MQPGQKWGESDWDYRQRKSSEDAANSLGAILAIFALATAAIAISWKLLKWLLSLVRN